MPGGFSSGFSNGFGPLYVTGLIGRLSDVLDVIQSVTAFDVYAVTPDEPPATDSCSAAYVWPIRTYDSGLSFSARGDDPTCVVRRTYEIGYRIDVCRKVRGDGKEPIPSEYLANALTFSDAMDAVWCALADAKVSGSIAEFCEDMQVGDLVVNSAQGDRISATGTINLTFPCPA